MKVALIGAGSHVFAVNIVTDLLSYPALRKNIHVCLMDINETRLHHTLAILETYKQDHADKLAGVRFSSTVNQREAVRDARYVLATFLVGGREAYQNDITIPHEHGVDQNVGDTVSPGAVFRFLRSVPVYRELLTNMKEVGYNAGESRRVKPLLLNYVNPMAMITWYCNATWPGSTVGLCHGVQHTAELGLQWWLGVSKDQLYYKAAGINHMAWFIDLKYKDPEDPAATWKDAYPLLEEHLREEPVLAKDEKVRFDMLRATGYFMTESSGHLAEYLPYYMKRADLRDAYRGERDVNTLSYEHALKRLSSMDAAYAGLEHEDIKHLPFKEMKSEEYAADIIHAMETNRPFVFNGNVMNDHAALIPTLPAGCCVEVPCTADFAGIHPEGGIELPTVCAALCSSNVMVQRCAVEAALTGKRELVYHALLLDPNTASTCSPGEIRRMTDELFAANARWLTWLE